MVLLFSGLAILAGYVIGSLSFAIIISRLMGLADPRAYGSGNPGATNVLRSGNKAAPCSRWRWMPSKASCPCCWC